MRKSQFDTALAGKASTTHSHAIGDVTGLQTALDGKASAAHGHAIADVTGLQGELDGIDAALAGGLRGAAGGAAGLGDVLARVERRGGGAPGPARPRRPASIASPAPARW